MILTDKLKKQIANLYWVDGLTFSEIKTFSRFCTLKEGQFNRVTRKLSPYDPEKRPTVSMAFTFKKGRTSYFMGLSEDEQLNFRKRVPIPEETKELFRTGRLSAYYNNPI